MIRAAVLAALLLAGGQAFAGTTGWREARATVHAGAELYLGRERAYVGRVVRVVGTPRGSAVVVQRGRELSVILRREIASGDYYVRDH